MAYRLVLPKFGMAMQSARIIEWKKEIGDYIELEEAVLVVENEKLSNEIISMRAGVLLKKVAEIGEDYQVGDTLAWLGEQGEKVEDDETSTPAAGSNVDFSASAPTPAADPPNTPPEGSPEAGRSGRVVASPLAKKLAAELHLDIAKIPGTGPGGRIDKDDVLNYSESLKQQPATEASVSSDQPEQTTPVAPAPAPAPAPVIPASTTPPSPMDPAETGYAVNAYAGMRKAIGDRMQGAWTTIPMVTHHVTADAGALTEIRKYINDTIEDKDYRYSINDLLLKLTATALSKMPVMNATFEADGIHIHQHVNLGMATALENGLIVPVLHKAEAKSLKEIRAEARVLSAAAQAGRLTPDNITGGTFTVSNLGGYGSVDLFSPIINPPQVAILGVGRITESVVAVGGEIKIRPLIGLSLTYDHRAIDGATAALFMKEFIALLSNPLQVLLR